MQKYRKSAPRRGGEGTRAKKLPIAGALGGAVIGLLITVISVLIFALIVRQAGMDDAAIGGVDQFIKIVSIFVAAFLASKKQKDRPLLTGALAGGLYVLMGYLAFSLVAGNLGEVGVLAADLAMGVLIGMLTALVFNRVFAPKNTAAKKHE